METEKSMISLAEMPVGMNAVVVKLGESLRSRKKFADAGLIPGAQLAMEARAPFGSLLRVKVLDCSMALHKLEGSNIFVQAI
ncbi:MAG: ferrous iron transport protein A [Lentisphaeria bacterium]|nr:ferrous iron transport protein A [Lentisphaeria bacterium]MBR7145216.1 ferrous iron transport protein A [Lentisphaeria bacterium]